MLVVVRRWCLLFAVCCELCVVVCCFVFVVVVGCVLVLLFVGRCSLFVVCRRLLLWLRVVVCGLLCVAVRCVMPVGVVVFWSMCVRCCWLVDDNGCLLLVALVCRCRRCLVFRVESVSCCLLCVGRWASLLFALGIDGINCVLWFGVCGLLFVGGRCCCCVVFVDVVLCRLQVVDAVYWSVLFVVAC